MDVDTALDELYQQQPLSIHKLSRPYLPTPNINENSSLRLSTETANSHSQSINPAILAADLAHYQELFTKLRFSYVEQVTKERFLRAITAEQPEFVQPQANIELEEQLKRDKGQLKERKVEVRELIGELEAQGRQLAHRHEEIQQQMRQLEALPQEIAVLEGAIASLRQAQPPQSDNPELRLPLGLTLNLLSDRESELSDLDRQIEALRSSIPRRAEEITSFEDDVAVLNDRKVKAVEEAQSARRRKANGGAGDDLDEKGRWLASVDVGLRKMLEI